MNHRHLVPALVLCASALFAEAGIAQGAKITAAGSSTVRPVVQRAAKAYKKVHPGTQFAIGGGGSSHGVKSAATGKVFLGMASRDLKAAEKKEYANLVATKIGTDGIAIIVNAKNPLRTITREQVQAIYTGKVRNWKELGGKDAPILLISKEEGRSTLELFLKYFGLQGKEVKKAKKMVMVHRLKPKKEDGKKDPPYSDVGARLIGPNKQALGAISTKPNGIAYVSVGTAQEVAQKSGRLKLLALDGVEATVKNVAEGLYPLRRPLNLLTDGKPKGPVAAFIDFLLSADGQKVVASLEFIPLADAKTADN